MKNSGFPIKFPPILLGAGVLLALYASSLYGFLFFHSLVEIFSVLVAFVIFVIVWNTRRIQDNHYLLFIGIASLFSGALDLAHTFAYKGLGVFPGYGADLATQLWIAFRYVFSLSFLFAPFFIERKLNPPRIFAACFIITSLLLVTIFLRRFPSCYVEGAGLTPFKIISEYIISFIFLAALGLLLRKRSAFDCGVLRLVVLSLLSSVASELSFTHYVSVYGFANMLGHYFELLSYYLIYRAIVVTGVVEPSNLLFRNLNLNEAALRESEAKYRSLFENMIDGFAYHKVIVDGKGRPVDYVFLEVNSAFERLTGLKREDITGKRVREVLPGIEDDPADWIGRYGRVALTGKEVRFERYAGPLDKWYSVTAYSPMKEYFVTVFEDITERKRVEEALRASEEQFRTLADSIPNLAWWANADGYITWYNRRWYEYTGTTPEQMKGWGWQSVHDPKALPKVLERWKVSIATGQPFDMEFPLRGADGVFRSFLTRVLPLKDSAGLVLRWLGTNTDISALKLAEDALRTTHAELEARVRERTAELAKTVNTLQTEVSERQLAEEKVLRLNRLYSVLSKINETIVRIHDPEKLYEQVCRIAVEDGLFKMAWIGLTDPETLMVKPVASWGDTGGYLDHIKIYAADVSEGRGPTGTAVSEGTYSICSDIEHDKRMLPWRDKALRHGFRSSAAFPLRAGSVVIGALTIYSDTPQFFTSDEINLLNSLVEDISFAIDFMANGKKRFEAEEEVRAASLYARSLIEASLDPLVTISTEGIIMDVNKATESVTGVARERLIGSDFSDYFTEPDKAREGYQNVFTKGLVTDYPLAIRHALGRITDVLYNAAVYKNEAGEVQGVFAAARDITERRETERRITVTNDLLKLFSPTFSRKEYLDSAMKIIREWSGCRYVGMRIADRDGNIPYEACAGFSSEFLESERVLSLKRDQCACTRVVAGTPEPQDMPAMTPNGSFCSNNTMKFVEDLTDEQKARFRGVCIRSGFASVAVVPIRYRDKVLGAIHLADEREGMVPLKSVEFIEQLALIIGEAVFRFGIEEEIWKLNRELEQRVIERTTQLEAANKELEAFSYSVSHDLRAPLRIIDGFSQAIEEEQAAKLDETGKDYFQRVRAASQRMAQLIDALLSLSRQTRGEPNRTMVDISSLAKSVADDLRRTQPDRRVEFVIADEVTAPADPVMLRAVLDNLLGNAWKFTEKRNPARIEFGFTRKEGQNVYFVRDNGAGFDMAYANKLFIAFQRLHSSSEFPGLGIGLATVQRIVHRHDGRIWAEGEVDKGAVFYFTL